MNKDFATVGDKIMRGEAPEDTISFEDALWIICLGLGLGKEQYRRVTIFQCLPEIAHIRTNNNDHLVHTASGWTIVDLEVSDWLKIMS